MEKHSDQSPTFKLKRDEEIESNEVELTVCNSVPDSLEQGARKTHLEEAINGIEEVFSVIEKRDIWGNFTRNEMDNMQEIRASISDLKQNISTDTSLKYESVKNEEDQKILLQTEVSSLTYKLKDANQVIEKQIKECKDKEIENSKLRSELEKSRKVREKHEQEMCIISLLSAFLYNHEKGVNIDSISSILNSSPIIHTVGTEEIEFIMRRHPGIFKEYSPSEATREKKWGLTQKTFTLKFQP